MYNTFRQILDAISNSEWKEVICVLLNKLPNDILTQPSSSSGKYHPRDEIGPDGMIKHVHRCAVLAVEICHMKSWGPKERDLLLAGCILHDIFKNGLDSNKKKKTDPFHAIYIYDFIMKFKEANYEKMSEELKVLAKMCLLHEGQWTVSEALAKRVQVEGITKELCDAMHIIDYFASRRSLYDIMQPQETWNLSEYLHIGA